MKPFARRHGQSSGSATLLLAAGLWILCQTSWAGSPAQSAGKLSNATHQQVQRVIEADSQRIESIFKDIHRNPELGFMETRTAGIVARELNALGFNVQTGIGKTGVMAILRNGDGPTVLYRADMDAVAVRETTNLPYASKVQVKLADGSEVAVAHACGHDAHVSWMLGMARAMVELKSQWSGTLVLVAQPAEELITGATAMVEAGLYNKYAMPRPDYMLALHTAPAPLGTIVSAGGVNFSGTDQLDVTFYGIGGHGSMPQHTKDPVLMAASAVVQYQSIISRSIDPQQTAVLTVGSIQSGANNNVIPDKAVLKINLRWFSDSVREQLLNGIRQINQSVAIANGMPEDKFPTIKMKGFSSPLVNDPALTARLATSIEAGFETAHIIREITPAMASEDAHLLLGDYADTPLAYLHVGIVDPETFRKLGNKSPYFNHNGDYKVELDAIPFGSRLATTAVLELMASQPTK
jgi:hippurate hydrolase